MKIVFQYITILAICAAGMACKKDNYKAPASILSGKLVYKGETIEVAYNEVSYQLYQFGFGKVSPIGGNFAQDGSYSADLFDGTYKLIIPNGQGPFRWKQLPSGNPDTTTITMSGNQTLDLEVTPYYMIRTPQFTGGAGKVTGTFKAEKIITDAVNGKAIDYVGIYINRTQFVSSSGDNLIGKTEIAGSAITDPNNISVNVSVPGSVGTQTYVYARIGLKVAGVEDLIFSTAQKITF